MGSNSVFTWLDQEEPEAEGLAVGALGEALDTIDVSLPQPHQSNQVTILEQCH